MCRVLYCFHLGPQVVTERDILGTQLIRRNDELALLYEKVKIMESTLKKGEAQYLDRLQDIRILKLKIGELKRELTIQNSKSGEITELRREVYRLQKELLQEKTKVCWREKLWCVLCLLCVRLSMCVHAQHMLVSASVGFASSWSLSLMTWRCLLACGDQVKALSEELENPMNVHRWRKLEGSDPATYEMIQKIQTLQKRLISKVPVPPCVWLCARGSYSLCIVFVEFVCVQPPSLLACLRHDSCQTEEAVEKELLIQEKDKLYIELKNILARQPGPEVRICPYRHSACRLAV
jgi:hypothetical protein